MRLALPSLATFFCALLKAMLSTGLRTRLLQFYPTLADIARQKGTFKSSAPK